MSKNHDVFLKSPPHSEEIERMILGIYIMFPETQEKINSELSSDDFYNQAAHAIFKYIYKYILKKDGVVTHTGEILDLLKKEGIISNLEMQNFVDDITGVVSKAGHEYMIHTLKDYTKRREIIAKCHSLINCCYDEYGTDIGDLIGDMRIILESEKRNLSQEIASWVEDINGTFYVTNCDTELQIVTKKDKANRRQVMYRLEKQGVIEKTGVTAGQYRKIDDNYVFEDWMGADESPFDIRLPLGLSQYCLIYPGDIFVFSGSKSTGKTALALETIRLNKRDRKVFYHSSELNRNTFKRRISKTNGFSKKEWVNVMFAGDLSADVAHDRVQPGEFNVFDYIEVDDGNYYKIPGIISKVHRKLRGGVALICLQKDKDKKFAVGGEQTRAKANLYCVLQPDFPGEKLIIDNCKAWAQEDVNPQGFEVHYKIVNGINIIQEGSLTPGLQRE